MKKSLSFVLKRNESGSPDRRSEAGFTLIETVAVLIIIGIIGALGGIGIIEGLEAFVMSRENIIMNQRTQLAVNRITMELQRMDNVVAANDDLITFTSVSRSFNAQCTIQRTGTQITLQVGANAAAPLIENVTGAVPLFTYLQSNGAAWTTASSERQLAAVTINVTVHRPNDILNVSDKTFTTRVTPRNNGVPNGPDPDPI